MYCRHSHLSLTFIYVQFCIQKRSICIIDHRPLDPNMSSSGMIWFECKKVGEYWNVCVVILSVRLYLQSHVYTSWIHSFCNSSYHFALTGLVFLSRRWVKSLLLLTDPCKSLSHTHSFSSFMAKLLFFHSPSG